MSKPRIVVIGSGIAGSTIAHLLSSRGYRVDVFEKGPEYPYPHDQQFRETQWLLAGDYKVVGVDGWSGATRTALGFRGQRLPHPTRQRLPRDLKAHTFSGDWAINMERERYMNVGGACAVWEGISPRMRPADFKRRSLFGYGTDWPLTYEELEPFYCRAERLIGVAGTDADNPFAPPRSEPYPLPPFELSYDDRILGERLQDDGIVLHTTPQARTSRPYDGRSPCINYRACRFCPIGARYSPNLHLQRAVATGRCRLHTLSSIRRILLDHTGRARAVVYRGNDQTDDQEHPADWIVLAAGTLESARLLLLSSGPRHPDGLGNAGGQVGNHLTFHHIWHGRHRFGQRLWPGRFGGWTGQCDQFLDPPKAAGHGGIKIEYASRPDLTGLEPDGWRSAADVVEDMEALPFRRPIAMHAETEASGDKYMTLSDRRDRFGDPLVHLHYELTSFDHATFEQAQRLSRRFAAATGAEEETFDTDPRIFSTAFHQMGGCRMGSSPADSVVTSHGQVHEIPNLVLAGSSIFAGPSGPMNPTLTIAALAIRTSEYLLHRLSTG